jgi:hypothetical protein
MVTHLLVVEGLAVTGKVLAVLRCPSHHLEKLSMEEDHDTIETAMLPGKGIEPLLLFLVADPGTAFYWR